MGDPQAALYGAQGRGPFSRVAGAAIDRLLARKATAIVVRGRGLVEVLSLRVPWIEIPDGVDVERFVPGVDGELRRELRIPADAPVAGVAGEPPRGEGRG